MLLEKKLKNFEYFQDFNKAVEEIEKGEFEEIAMN